MKFSLATLRLLFRVFFGIFFVKTDKVLRKDVQCFWVLIYYRLLRISVNLDDNGDMETLIKDLENTTAFLVGSSNALARILKNQAKTKDEEYSNRMERLVLDYNKLIVTTDRRLRAMINRAKEKGRLTKDDKDYLKDCNRWLLVVDKRAQEFLTEEFMLKSLSYFMRKIERMQRLNQ